MIRLFRLIIGLLFTLLYPLSSSSQTPPGSWRMIPSFTAGQESVVETPAAVWFMSGGSLFVIDKDSDETSALTTDSGLSDHDISLLRYNPERGYLLVGYSTGNIDLIYDTGEIVNLSDIRDASVQPKTINDIAFSGDNIYVATGFGLVRFSESKRAVADSGRYGKNIDGVTVAGNRLIISTENNLLSVEQGSRINSLDAFTSLGDWTEATQLEALQSDLLIASHTNGTGLYHITPGGWIEGITRTPAPAIGQISVTSDGTALWSDGRMLYTFNPNSSLSPLSSLILPEKLTDNTIASFSGPTSLWALNTDGLTNMVASSSGWATAMERFRPEALAVREAAFIIPGASPERIYFTNLGPTVYRMGISGYSDGSQVSQQAAMITEGSLLSSLTLLPPLNAPTRLAENPADPHTVYMASGNSGIHKVTDGKDTGSYTAANSPMSGEWGSAVFEVSFDRAGNLWVGCSGLTNNDIIVLPAEKLRVDPSAIKASDWIVPISGCDLSMDMRIFHCLRSPMTFIFDNGQNGLLTAYHNNGTPATFSDDRSITWTSFTDQDGREFAPNRCTSIAEDRKGRVWIGTSGGIMVIDNPEKAIDPTMTVHHLKIAHNDGTSLADYLLETDAALDICTDGADRKWIATNASGLYLLDSEGTEIISRFTSANSPLPADRVNAVYADELSNTVYIATPYGVMEYGGTAAPPAEDYSAIRVYPNPVTPEFTGSVTIEGLTEGSLVKIADSAGSVVWQGRAEGGMARWPAENAAGRRVPSGVYYLLPSPQPDGTQATPAAVKILVIN